jgi:tRNA pseudouridine13 synthase
MELPSEATNSGALRAPAELPFEHPDLPALGGQIGPEPEDFVVDEVPLYAAAGQGDHWYVRLGKRERTTADLKRAVAQAASVPEREIGHAGLKDKHAVTSQWLSVPVPRTTPPSEWQLPEPYRLLEVTRHANKLRIGHLEGNRFRIRLVGLPPSGLSAAAALCQRVVEQGIGNYFGSQRFGLGQRNLETALTLLARRRLGPRAGQRGKFLASVIQSEIFNRYLILRSELGRQRLLLGDVVRLQGSRAVFVVEDPEKEAPRLAAGDIHLTGPLVGPKMKASEGEPLELERAVLASLGLDEDGLRELGRSAPGTRRDLVLRPEALTWQPDGAEPGSLVVEFGLPAGAYASLVIRALTRQDPWKGANPEGDEREDRAGEERTTESVEHESA